MLIEKVISQGEVLTSEQLVKVTGGVGSGMGTNSNWNENCVCDGGSGDNSNNAKGCHCKSSSSTEEIKQNTGANKEHHQ